jgi:hypothetical protein
MSLRSVIFMKQASIFLSLANLEKANGEHLLPRNQRKSRGVSNVQEIVRKVA